MDDLLQETFRQRFTGLTGNASPFAWQEGLFAAFFQGSLPARIDLPTGSGKTSVMASWLLALAAQAEKGAVGLPRRLVWVVDRRGVVDQATEEADRLGISAATLDEHGAVSEAVARQMAEGARQKCRVDYALSVTGIAGPGGGTQSKPDGTVFMALADEKGTTVERHFNPFDRETFKHVTSQQAMDLLRRALLS